MVGEWGRAPILDKSESFVVISFWGKKIALRFTS